MEEVKQIDYAPLEEKIGYKFTDPSLLRVALTHASFHKQKNNPEIADNERMEFLGDRVLGLSVADILYSCFPEEKEGVLAKRHAALVRQDTLADIAQTLRLGGYLSLSQGEINSGGREKPTILSDALEALIAAVFIDGGFEPADKFIQKFWTRKIKLVETVDAKSRLQEWLQSKGEALPEYKIIKKTGKAHAQHFVVQVLTKNHGEMEGEGSSKQQAEQDAAAALLYELEVME